jgi:hypothetical protein
VVDVLSGNLRLWSEDQYIRQGGIMARRSQHSFLKRQKEIKRKETAAEKMARRQGKIERAKNGIDDDQEAIITETDDQEANGTDEQTQDNS